MSKKALHIVGLILEVGLFLLAIGVIYHISHKYSFGQVWHELRLMSVVRLVIGVILTLLGYFILTLYDVLAFHHIRHSIAFGKVVLASFVGHAFANNIGLSMLTGGSVRYRLYSSWGLSHKKISQVLLFCGLTFVVGFLIVGGSVLFVHPIVLPSFIPIPVSVVRSIGLVFLLLGALYLLWSAVGKQSVKIASWEFHAPKLHISLAQVAIYSIELMIGGGVFYLLLPHADHLTFFVFLGIYVIAHVIGLVSQVPGGLGVFETMMIFFLAPVLPEPAVLGALLLFRVIYYVFPFVLAVIALGVYEMHQRRETLKKLLSIVVEEER